MRGHLFSTVLCLMLAIGSTSPAANKYVGTWVATDGGSHRITFAKNDKAFLVTLNFGDLNRQPLPATLDANTGMLNISARGMNFPLPLESSTGHLLLEGKSFKKQ